MLKVSLEAPWQTFAKKLKALFERDPQIKVSDVYEIDDDDVQYGIDIEIRNSEKYKALDRVLPSVKSFGGVSLAITLYDEENAGLNSDAALYETIFNGNPILKEVKDVVDHTGSHIGYVVFNPEVIQFFDDDLSSYNGKWSGLAQDIAKDVFDNDFRGVYFCTADVNEGKEAENAAIASKKTATEKPAGK